MSIKNCSLLIPTYNEEKNLINIIRTIYTSKYPAMIVNDGSTDSTHKILKWLQRANGIKVISYKYNEGKGYAIKRGAKKLIKQGFEWILILDSDGQMDIEDIIQFENILKIHPDARIIIGNRLHNHKNMPKIRYITNRIMSWFISLLAGQKIVDSQCGFRLIHRDIFGIRTNGQRFEYESEQLIKAGRRGFKIISIPIKCIYEKGRISKINPIKDIIRFFKMLYNLFYN